MRLKSSCLDGPPARTLLTSNARKSAAEPRINGGAYNVRKDCLNQAHEEGDSTGVPSLEMLRQAATEWQVLGRLGR